MKLFFQFLLLVTFSCLYLTEVRCQDEDEAYSLYKKVYGRNDKDFKITSIPEDMDQNESTILAQKAYLEIEYNRNQSKYFTFGLVRKRIIIKDNATLEQLSEFYFSEGDGLFVTVIKPDGKKINVSTDDPVKVTKEVPRIFQNEFRSSSYLKIAIPDLEIGDIIDFIEYFDRSDFYLYGYEQIRGIKSNYPIAFNELTVAHPKHFDFRSVSCNEAPEFKEYINTSKKLTKEKKKYYKDYRIMRMVSERTPKYKDLIWQNEFVEEPYIIYSIYCKDHLSDPYEDDKLSPYKIHHIISYKFMDYYVGLRNQYADKIDKKSIKSLELKEREIAIFNAYRYAYMSSIREEKGEYKYDGSDYNSLARNYNSQGGTEFVNLFGRILKKYDIPFEYAYGYSPYLGKPEDAISINEIKLGIYLPENDKYVWGVDHFWVEIKW